MQQPSEDASEDCRGMFSGLMSGSYALDAVLGTDRGGAGSRARPSINASVTATVFRRHPNMNDPAGDKAVEIESLTPKGQGCGSY